MPKVVVKKKKRKASKPESYKGSIVIKTEMVPLDELNKYYKNPNIGDVEKVAESLHENGQYKSIVANVGTQTGRPNEVLGGNHTFMAARSLDWPEIQVDWVDVSEEHARRIVLADNGSRDGARYDDNILAELLSDQKKETGTLVGTTLSDDLLDGLMKKSEVEGDSSGVDKIEDASEHLEGLQDLQNDVFFPSDLDYEIPELLPDMIPDEPPDPMKVWAGHELDGKDKIGEAEWSETWWLSMWHAGSMGINWSRAIPYFYTDDFHFEPIYSDPAKNTKKILNLGIQMAIMPNYTIHKEMPTALWVYATYRSYFVARYFQEAGIKIIPDIQVGNTDSVLDLSLIGIPQGAGVVSAQVQMANGMKDRLRRNARLLKEAEDRLGFKNILIYGHTDADEVIERAGFSCNVIKITARTARRREYLNSGSTINSQQIKGKKKRKVKR